MKFMHYVDQYDITHYIDVSEVMATDTFPLGVPDENGVFPEMGTRICLKTKVGGYVISKETPEVLWPRIREALK